MLNNVYDCIYYTAQSATYPHTNTISV